MGMSKTQRKSIDEALLRLDQQLPSFKGDKSGVVSDAHLDMPLQHRVKIDWKQMPGRLDPHSMTWRGSSIPTGSDVKTTSHATMKETINPRSQRKRAQVENFASMLALFVGAESGSIHSVVDFGCGSGNLVLPIAHLFPQLQFVGVDMKPAALEILRARAAEAGLSNVAIHHGAIETYAQDFDLALSLHACGPASDAVLCASLEQVRLLRRPESIVVAAQPGIRQDTYPYQPRTSPHAPCCSQLTCQHNTYSLFLSRSFPFSVYVSGVVLWGCQRAIFIVSPCCIGKLTAQGSVAPSNAVNPPSSLVPAPSSIACSQRGQSRRLEAAGIPSKTWELMAQVKLL